MHKIRAPYEPNQNPVAERRLRTNVEMARTMMLQASAPSYTWEDAFQHANYICNRVVTKAVKGMTPFERFWGRRPNLEWTKTFACLVFILIHKETRDSKFEATAVPGILLCVSERHSAYKVELLGS